MHVTLGLLTVFGALLAILEALELLVFIPTQVWFGRLFVLLFLRTFRRVRCSCNGIMINEDPPTKRQRLEMWKGNHCFRALSRICCELFPRFVCVEQSRPTVITPIPAHRITPNPRTNKLLQCKQYYTWATSCRGHFFLRGLLSQPSCLQPQLLNPMALGVALTLARLLHFVEAGRLEPLQQRSSGNWEGFRFEVLIEV